MGDNRASLSRWFDHALRWNTHGFDRDVANLRRTNQMCEKPEAGVKNNDCTKNE